MPRQRQRIVFCDCFDCRDRVDEPELTSEQLNAATAVARQEPPPKALILYATGFVLEEDGATTLDASTLPHCDLLVREGNLGLLAVRRAQDAAAELTPAALEVAQLLGVFKDLTAQQGPSFEGNRQQTPLPSLAARFKGMQAALASSSAPVCTLAQRQGIAVLENLCLGPGSGTCQGPGVGAAAEEVSAAMMTSASVALEDGAGAASGTTMAKGALRLPNAGAYASQVAAELGAAEGSSGRDLVLLHWDLADLLVAGRGSAGDAKGSTNVPQTENPTGHSQQDLRGSAVAEQRTERTFDGVDSGDSGPAGERAAGLGADGEARWNAGCEALEWLDGLIRSLMALPERERTLLVVVLSPAGQPLSSVRPQGVLMSVTGVRGGDSGGTSGAVLQPGGTSLDPAAAIVTPQNAAAAAQLAAGSRGGAAAAATAAAGLLSALDAEEFPLVSRPAQSFEFLGLDRVAVELRSPVLVARRLPGVVRRDRAERLSYKEALAAGGQGAVLLERLLPEVAYKVGRAPKYGA